MGNAGISRHAVNQSQQDPRTYFQTDLPNFIVQKRIGNGKFMKTYLVNVDGVPLVVKVYMKQPDEDLQIRAVELSNLWKNISSSRFPNLLPYQMWIKSSLRLKPNITPIYLIRQYVQSNLHDRLSTRPFLSSIEKRWLLYQLFKGLEICHLIQGITHGDIKPENILCTSWNWLMLTDFASFKPATLPDDDPSDFQFYFDTMGRNSCYIAPERFYKASMTMISPPPSLASTSSGGLSTNATTSAPVMTNPMMNDSVFNDGYMQNMNKLTIAIDVFSLGCTMAEIFLDGDTFLDLPGMLRYISAGSQVTPAPTSRGLDTSRIDAITTSTSTNITSSTTSTPNTTTNINTNKTNNNNIQRPMSMKSLQRLDEEDSPAKALLNRIPDKLIRDVIIDMTQRNPDKRANIRNYRHILEGRRAPTTLAILHGMKSGEYVYPPPPTTPSRDTSTTTASTTTDHTSSSSTIPQQPVTSSALYPFPKYFAQTIYPVFQKLHTLGVTPDDRIVILCENYDVIISGITGREDTAGSHFFQFCIDNMIGAQSILNKNKIQLSMTTTTTTPVNTYSTNIYEKAIERPPSIAKPKCISSIFNAVDKHKGEKLTPMTDGNTTIQTSSGTSSSSSSLSSNTTNKYNMMPIDELMEKCITLIDNLDKLNSGNTVNTLSSGVKSSTSSTTTNSSTTTAGQTTTASSSRYPNKPHLDENSVKSSLSHILSPTLPGVNNRNTTVKNSLSAAATNSNNSSSTNGNRKKVKSADCFFLSSIDAISPPLVNTSTTTTTTGSISRSIYEGLLLPIQVICSGFRSVQHPHTRMISLMLLVRMGVHCGDDVILHRILPVFIHALEDLYPQVRACALRGLRVLLSVVQHIDTTDANIFQQYIVPAINGKILKDNDVMVRVAFAESLGRLAYTAKRFLDYTHMTIQKKTLSDAMNETAIVPSISLQSTAATNTSTTTTTSNMNAPSLTLEKNKVYEQQLLINFQYDTKLKYLHDTVNRWMKELLTDTLNKSRLHLTMKRPAARRRPSTIHTDTAVSASSGATSSWIKRMLLTDIHRLCMFYGHEGIDTLLHHLLTFMNDPDWEVRCAFLHYIPSVCIYIGPVITLERIIPCLETGLVDIEERIVTVTLQALTTLVQTECLTAFHILIPLVKKSVSLVVHPCYSIRQATINFFDSILNFVGPIDSFVFILPLLKPVQKFDLSGYIIDIQKIKISFFSPVSRLSYRYVLNDYIRACTSDIIPSKSIITLEAYSGTERSLKPSNTTLNNLNSNLNSGISGRKSFSDTIRKRLESMTSITPTSSGAGTPRHSSTTSSPRISARFSLSSIREAANPTLTLNSDKNTLGNTMDDIAFSGDEHPYDLQPQQQQQQQQQQNDSDTFPVPFTPQDSYNDDQMRAIARIHQPSIDPVDIPKIKVLSSYIESLAKEMYTKSSNSKINAPNVLESSRMAGPNMTDSTLEDLKMLESSFDLNATPNNSNALLNNPNNTSTTADFTVECNLVPNQKFGHFYFPTFSSESIRVRLYQQDLFSYDQYKLRALYGLYTIEYAKKAISNGMMMNITSDFLIDINIPTTLAENSPRPSGSSAALMNTANTSAAPLSTTTATSGSTAGQQNTTTASNTGPPSAEYTQRKLSVTGPPPSTTTDTGTNTSYMGSKLAIVDNEITRNQDTYILKKRIKALKIPPLPPYMGSILTVEERRNLDSLDMGNIAAAATSDPTVTRSGWRPKENTLVTILREHTHSVNQLAVTPDQYFFVSGSSDHTVKIWPARSIEHYAVPRSVLTYRKHLGPVTSVAILENSHSVISGSDDGSVHIWRVDYNLDRNLPNNNNTNGGSGSGSSTGNMSRNQSFHDLDGSTIEHSEYMKAPASYSEIKQLQNHEGSIVAVNHFNHDIPSVVTYVTQYGSIYGWDLRCTQSAFHYKVRPELGQCTSMAVSPDRSWLCVGTTKGYISLWDLRYNMMNSLWRHSSEGSIYRLATCKALQTKGVQAEQLIGPSQGAYLFIAAGVNEAAVWGIPEGGECLKCFRSVPYKYSQQPLSVLPYLMDVNLPRHPYSPIQSALDRYDHLKLNNTIGHSTGATDPSFRSILGRISDKGTSYLVTAGTDRQIRYWDFSHPTKCFTVTGLSPCQPKPVYEVSSMDTNMNKLMVCYDAAEPSADTLVQAQLPIREGRGPLPPPTNFKDAITDLKSIESPLRLMISASRDGDIKIWR